MRSYNRIQTGPFRGFVIENKLNEVSMNDMLKSKYSEFSTKSSKKAILRKKGSILSKKVLGLRFH